MLSKTSRTILFFFSELCTKSCRSSNERMPAFFLTCSSSAACRFQLAQMYKCPVVLVWCFTASSEIYADTVPMDHTQKLSQNSAMGSCSLRVISSSPGYLSWSTVGANSAYYAQKSPKTIGCQYWDSLSVLLHNAYGNAG